MSSAPVPQVGDRVRPVDYDTLCGRVEWIGEARLIALVVWEDGSGCDYWPLSRLEVVRKGTA